MQTPAGFLYIYPLPLSLNCSGTVSSIGYCYFDDRDLTTSTLIFTLFTLEQDGMDFNISKRIEMFSTPDAQKCTAASDGQYCCDTYVLSKRDRFHLPTLNFAFGILTDFVVLLLGFSNEYIVQQYNGGHYSQGNSGLLQVGNIINNPSIVPGRGLRLFQFFIGMQIIIERLVVTVYIKL